MVKKLKDFKGQNGVTTAVRLLAPVGRITRGKDSIDLAGKSMLEYFAELFARDPDDVWEMMAILSGTELEDFSCDGAEAMQNLALMISDPDLMAFFGLQRRTPDALPSAPENTEAPKASNASSPTAPNDENKG